MCGIVGIVYKDEKTNAEEIRLATEVLHSRGPDEGAVWFDKNVALGHRRLSIIDLADGHQPMRSRDGRFVLVYNGELYNYKELRKQLEKKGHQFFTSSDTEVLLHAYIEWEKNCVEHFRGMFAFAILDRYERTLFLARDHLGIKPLIYYHDAKQFIFASEIRAIRSWRAQLDLTFDLKAIDQYLRFQYIPAPRTVYRKMRKLRPGYRMKITLENQVLYEEPYWDLDFSVCKKKSEDEWLEELDKVFEESVRLHTVADVPFGAFLSGGIDSTLVISYMNRVVNKPVETFTIGFEEEEYSELNYASMAAKRFETKHHEMIVRPDALGILPELVRHYGEPFGDSSAVPTYYVSKLARNSVPMVLSGDGADEIFAGYHSYAKWMRFLDINNHPPFWKRELRHMLSRFFPERYPYRPRYGDGLEQWLSIIQYIDGPLRSRLWKKPYKDAYVKTPSEYIELYEKVRELTPLKRAQYMDIKTYLPYAILTKVDVASMMHGLEVRTPITDYKVYEFAASIPNNMNLKKINGDYQGKYLLKKLLSEMMPDSFLYRKKMGFAMPIKNWFSSEGEYRKEVESRLLGDGSELKEFFDSKIIHSIIQSGRFGNIWLLLFLEEWLRQERFQ
jgi:asparagine synthase (glutamine-hydrolysing)